MSTRISRRALLRAAGLTAAAVPLLDDDFVSAAGFPRRLIVVLQSEGAVANSFFPPAGTTDLSAITLPTVLAPLEPHKRDLVVLDGVAMMNFIDYQKVDNETYGAGHENYACTFTGVKGNPAYRDSNGPRYFGGGPSFDQVIADGVTKQAPSPFRSLHLATNVAGTFELFNKCFYRNINQPITPEQDPQKVLGALFASKPMGDPAIDKQRLERSGLLDYLGANVERFAKRVGRDDREKVQAYLASLKDLQTQVAAGVGSGAGCTTPAIAPVDVKVNDRYPDLVKAHLDLTVAALACDLTRVVTIQLNDASGTGLVFSWIKELTSKNVTFNPGGLRNYHDLGHSPGDNGAEKVKADRWFIEQFAYLLTKLKSVKEGDGTLLDNTAVLWGNHMGNGGAHSSDRLPWLIAGSCGGAIRTGRMLKTADHAPTNHVFCALANAMGVPMSGIGEARYSGVLPGLLV